MKNHDKIAGAMPAEHGRIRALALQEAHLSGVEDEASIQRIYHAIQYREFMAEIEPIIRVKAKVLSGVMPTIYMTNSRIRVEYDLSLEQRKALDQADEIIVMIAARYGVEIPDTGVPLAAELDDDLEGAPA